MENLKGKVAVVTGAASGIGFAMAERFAGEGMRVVLADIERDALEKACAKLTATGHEAAAVHDVRLIAHVSHRGVVAGEKQEGYAPVDQEIFQQVGFAGVIVVDVANGNPAGGRDFPHRELVISLVNQHISRGAQDFQDPLLAFGVDTGSRSGC